MKRDDSARNIDGFFENLLPVPALLEQLEKWLGKRFSRNTVYKWTKMGMPAQKICGDLYFKKDEVALWLQRTSKS